jgi:hypothetical protein
LELPPALKKWIWLVVPAVAVIELALHAKQVNGVASDGDWKAAKAEVEKRAKPEDLVAFAPQWVDPIGREHFGNQIANLEREAYPDVTRFPRAIEVSIRGEHLADLAGWRETDRTNVGAIRITTFENPAPVTLKDDLLRHVGKPDMKVSLVDPNGEHECAFGRFGVQTGNLGFGPAVPSLRYQCGGGAFAGISVMPDLDYRPRRCIYAPAQGQNTAVKLRFDAIVFGKVLHGHHGLYVEAERDQKGAPVAIQFRSGEKTLGKLVHRDGEGWKNFELDTSELDGTTAELVAEITSSSRDRRQYCFEADTR